jgi:hypothetical protein
LVLEASAGGRAILSWPDSRPLTASLCRVQLGSRRLPIPPRVMDVLAPLRQLRPIAMALGLMRVALPVLVRHPQLAPRRSHLSTRRRHGLQQPVASAGVSLSRRPPPPTSLTEAVEVEEAESFAGYSVSRPLPVAVWHSSSLRDVRERRLLTAHPHVRHLAATARVWRAPSRVDPRRQQDWVLKCLHGG